MKHNLTVGQVLYNWSLQEVTITSIGKKYFYTTKGARYNFEIETLKYQDKVYSQNNTQLYLTKQEIIDQKELDSLDSFVKNFFWQNKFGKLPLTRDQLQQIKAIIES